MSAAAPAVPRKGAATSDSKLPAWFLQAVGGRGWTAVPNAAIERLGQMFSGLETAVVMAILRFTVGDERNGRPEWAALPYATMARWFGAHENGVAKAVERLEAAGAIESRVKGCTCGLSVKSPKDCECQLGRGKEYRAVVAAWASLPLRGPRKLDRSATTSGGEQTEDVSAQVVEMPHGTAPRTAPSAVRVVIAGDSVPRPLHQVCPAAAAAIAEHLANHKDCKLHHACVGSHEVVENAPVNAEIPTLQCGNGPSAPGPVPPGYKAFHDRVDRELRQQIAEPAPAAITEAAWRRLAQHKIPADLFFARLAIKKRKIYSYGFLENLVGDCIRAYEQAEDQGRRVEDAHDNERMAKALRAHIDRAADVLASRHGLFDELVDLLRGMARDSKRWIANPVDADIRLSNAVATMFAVVEQAQTPQDKATIDNAVTREMSPLRERLTKAQYDEHAALARQRALREHHRLPLLGLAYVEAP